MGFKKTGRGDFLGLKKGISKESLSSSTSTSDLEELDRHSSEEMEGVSPQTATRTLSYKNVFLEQFENLSEKRGTTRQAALSVIQRILAHHYAEELLENKVDTLLDVSLNGIKKGGDEALLSVKMLHTLIVSIIEVVSDERLNTITETLEGLAKSHDASLRAAAVETAFFWRYIRKAVREPWSDREVENMMSDLWQLVISRCAICIKVWGVLATMLSTGARASYLMDVGKKPVVEGLLRLLDDDVIDVRTSAGETIALLYEAYYHDIQENETGDEATNKRADMTYNILTKLQQLSTESSKKKTKKERKIERASFREILATVEDGAPVIERLTVSKQEIEFHGWERVLLFNYFRDLLGPGIVEHMKDNPILRDHIFHDELGFVDFSQEVTKLSALEKRLFMSDTSEISKLRTVNKSKISRNAAFNQLNAE